METPQWLTSELVQKFLGQSDELDSFSVESATKPGDNFLSVIYCVKVKTTENVEKSLILKTAMDVDGIEAFQAFPKETLCYKEFIPAYQRVWFEYTGEKLSFGPKLYYAEEQEPVTMIVMEDLRSLGYTIRDRKKGLNGREMRMVLEKAAKFHACSRKIYEQNGPYASAHLFDEGVARTDLREMFELYYNTLFEQFLWGIETHVENGSQYTSKLSKLRGTQFELLNRLTRADPNKLSVLCHCDLWVNNFLFNNTEEDSSEVLLIDFQISQWASPTVDILYSIFNSCDPKTIVDEFDDMLQCYYTEFTNAMKTLQCTTELPTLEEFTKELDARGSIVCLYISETLALSKADTKLNLDLESLTDDSEEAVNSRREIFSSPEFVDAMNLLLPLMDKRGYLEF